jgi:hypothetical protein
MAQIKSSFEEARVPFAKMTFSPDVPSTALGPNEYNAGQNVESDVRGIRSMAGDQAIMDALPEGESPTFVTGGFRLQNEFWFIVACDSGRWFATTGGDEGWVDISPGGVPIPGGYAQNTNITEAWNGTVPFFNDAKTAPMFWPNKPGAILVQYSDQVPIDIEDIVVDGTNPTQRIVSFEDFSPATPFPLGNYVQLQNCNPRYYNGVYEILAATSSTITISSDIVQPFVSGTIAPLYSWNYNPNWKSVFANFMRLYNTPNVGSILVAGNLTATNLDDTVENYPTTVQWSQAFGLNEAPLTWQPTVTNVANQLEVPLRGEALDAFPCNGQFFLCSYWDTVVFSPINYSTTSAPILGVRLFNQGRGLLSSNCWANTDKLVYGVDARDIWVFDGTDFQGIGNQRVKYWFYDQIDPEYYDRIFMEVNSQKNQVEIYYPDRDAIGGVPNKMLSYRYDLDCWNAPREVADATFTCESPIWLNSTDSSLPYWTPNKASRTVVYARGVEGSQLIQKDQGFSWYDEAPIESVFRRDNIKMLPNYSGLLMVHRILPEAINLGAYPDSTDDELPQYPSTGNISVKIQGAGSVGAEPASTTAVTMALNTDQPWCQINQNAYRVNSIELSNTSNVNVWMCSATTWQFTQVEDDR